MLTAFRSNTPSFASWSSVTNLVVSRPRLFSCRLGVGGCSESPAAPGSPRLLADSSSIIIRDQLRASPCCLPDQTQPASPGKHAPPPRSDAQQAGGSVWRIAGGCLSSSDPGSCPRSAWIEALRLEQQFNDPGFRAEPLATRGMTGRFNRSRERLRSVAPFQKRETTQERV